MPNIRHYLFILLLTTFPIIAFADSYDPNNYRPENPYVQIDETNLPIVFIDTKYGAAEHRVIHKDYAIAVRMKVINNPDGINYGDTIAHPQQVIDYEGWISIKYRGNTSFSVSEKKPFTIRTLATSDVNGSKQKVEIMGMPNDNHWVLLAPFNDRSMIRDVLIFQLARPYFDYTPRVRHCEVIIDGCYYGVYVMAEKPSKGKYRMNLDDPGDSGDALTGGYQLEIDRDDEPYYFRSKYIMKDKNGRPYSYNKSTVFQYKHPDYEDMMPDHPEQVNYIQKQIDQMEIALLSSNFADTVIGYRKYMDVMSFIDQQLCQEVSGNIDGYRLSTNIYKQRDSQDPHFKTTLWDFNLAFGNAMQMRGTETDYWLYQNTYIPSYDYKVPFWWERMMEDPAYVDQLKKRWREYRCGSFSDTHLEIAIDSLVNLLKEKNALTRNNQSYQMFDGKYVWPVPNVDTVNTYEKEIDYLKSWLKKRVAWLDNQLNFDASNIISIKPEKIKQTTGIYNSSGMPLQTIPEKGIYIIRYSDGTCRKLFANPSRGY